MKKPAAMNLIDRLVGYLDPGAGLRRLQQRHVLSQVRAATSPYEADTAGRHSKFYTDHYSPNQLTQKSAQAIRAQARQMQRNDDVSRGIIRTMVNNVVGPNGVGVEFQPRKADGTIHEEYAKALRDAWREHMMAPDVTRRHTGAKVQRLMAATWVRDGEAFAQELVGKVPGLRHRGPVPLSLEMFEADLVPYDYRAGANTHQGIARNAWGQPVGYYVLKGHPGDNLSAADVKYITAERVHHLAFLDRIGQMRGVSEFASILGRLKDIKDYEESERIAAKIAAAMTAYVKKTTPDGYAGPPTDANGNAVARQMSMAPGMIIDSLVVGEEIGMITSDRPNPNVVTFRQGQLRAVAAGVGASYSSIARDYNGTFSAQRQELVEQWVNYATLTDEFVGQFLQPWVTTFVTMADISGAVPMPADVVPSSADDVLFIAQNMPWIDPAKEANAWVALTRAGFASEVEVMRKRGVNPRDVLEQLATWRKLVAEKGLVVNSDAAVPEATGTQQTAGDGTPFSNPLE